MNPTAESGWESALIGWLLTYSVHSTALLGSVALLVRWRWVGTPEVRETLWRIALLGGVLTSGLQAVSGLTPLSGSYWVTSLSSSVFSLPKDQSGELQLLGGEAIGFKSRELLLRNLRGGAYTFHAFPRALPPPPLHNPLPQHQVWRFKTVDSQDEAELNWGTLLLGFWGLGALLMLLRVGNGQRKLKRLLRGREDLNNGRCRAILDELCAAAGCRRPRLTRCSALSGPIAMAGREICIPERALKGLGADLQRGLLAHELAHLVRRDPFWFLSAALLEALFFFQPLNRLARRGIQEAAEFQCDDWAVRQTGEGTTLAACLAEVAGWMQSAPQRDSLAPAMAGSESAFLSRVQRLCQEGRQEVAPLSAFRKILIGLSLPCLVLALAPAVLAGPAPTGGSDSKPNYLIVRIPNAEKAGDAARPLAEARKIYTL